MSEKVIYEFGPFSLGTDDRLLKRNGEPLHLAPKATDLLYALITAEGRVVAKADLIKAVWPDTFVTESSLMFHMSRLRAALGDEADQPKYIETFARRGYRFV